MSTPVKAIKITNRLLWIAWGLTTFLSCIPDYVPPRYTDKRAPGAVSDLVAEPYHLKIILRWKEPPDKDFKGVQINYSVLESAIKLAKGTTSYEFSNLRHGVEYEFRIFSEDTAGNVSSIEKVTSQLINNAPSVPELKTPRNGAPALFPTFSWSSSSDADGDKVTYEVYIIEEDMPLIFPRSEQSTTTYFPHTNFLQKNKKYHWQVRATDSFGGESSSEIWKFSTSQDIFIDERDNQSYQVVGIGTQLWMAENLSYLPHVSPKTDGSEDDGQAQKKFYYVYDYQGTTVDEAKSLPTFISYGVLYNWYAAKDACPEGWRLPTNKDWEILIDYTGHARELKARNDWYPATSGKDTHGFNAMPAGRREVEGNFFGLHQYAQWWASAPSPDEEIVDTWYIRYLNESVLKAERSPHMGFSVRCIKD